jgi:hypothetical protein
MSGVDAIKLLGAIMVGLACFVLVNTFIPHLAFEGLGALNVAIEFAVVFIAASIALRLGRYANARWETGLKPRAFVLALGGLTLLWLAYAMSDGDTLGGLIVALVADGLAILAIWAQSGKAELA